MNLLAILDYQICAGAFSTYQLARLKKSIYSLIDLRGILAGCNKRYLAFLSSLDAPSRGERDLQRLSQTRKAGEERLKGINFFAPSEQQVMRALQCPEFNIHGLRRADLARHVCALSPSALSRQLTRLRVLGLIKKAPIPIATTSPV